MSVDPQYPYIGQYFIQVVLSCGCIEQWNDGYDLTIGVYCYCKTHGDTIVKQVLAEPTNDGE